MPGTRTGRPLATAPGGSGAGRDGGAGGDGGVGGDGEAGGACFGPGSSVVWPCFGRSNRGPVPDTSVSDPSVPPAGSTTSTTGFAVPAVFAEGASVSAPVSSVTSTAVSRTASW